MTRSEVPREDADRTSDAESLAARRRRRARVFGETLPEGSSDERPGAWGDRESAVGDDERLRREVPPHHG